MGSFRDWLESPGNSKNADHKQIWKYSLKNKSLIPLCDFQLSYNAIGNHIGQSSPPFSVYDRHQLVRSVKMLDTDAVGGGVQAFGMRRRIDDATKLY